MDAVLENRRAIAFDDLEALLKGLRLELTRQSGSHRIYVHHKIPRPFPIQRDSKEAKRYQIRQLRHMIELYGLSLDERA